MDPLSEGFVEKTWQQVAAFTADRANKEMIAMGKNQPDLLAFLMAYTDDLQQEVKELAIFYVKKQDPFTPTQYVATSL